MLPPFYPSLHSNYSHLLPLAVIGFPKTGTSTMLRWLPMHPELSFTEREDCPSIYFADCANDPKKAKSCRSITLDNNVNLLSAWEEGDEKPVLDSLKCPSSAEEPITYKIFSQMFPSTPIIIGVRHPVLWFESFWNFRITKGSRYKDEGVVPWPDLFFGEGEKVEFRRNRAHPRRGHFHAFLSLMGFTTMDTVEERDLLGPIYSGMYAKMKKHKNLIKGFKNRVFIYETNQLSDDDGEAFKHSLLSFVGVDPTFSMPPMYKVVPGVANAAYLTNGPKDGTEYDIARNRIDICSSEHDKAREELMVIARNASEWIIGYLMKGKNNEGQLVTAEGFKEKVEEWMIDPCVERRKVYSDTTIIGG
ncbi:hypothetical protein TrCOL_g4186 [Triparma columacea]|uniref:Sulfotransferase n=1 Tax=Triparma columacea TaxID=722753 RepID=A0A9W7LCM1_9STRA|nr:hypothetical protein TrCOL_g4186 [Triparma columacea]